MRRTPTILLLSLLAAVAPALPASAKNPLDLAVHGNWCGPGARSGPVTDTLDMACRAHDLCARDRGLVRLRLRSRLHGYAAPPILALRGALPRRPAPSTKRSPWCPAAASRGRSPSSPGSTMTGAARWPRDARPRRIGRDASCGCSPPGFRPATTPEVGGGGGARTPGPRGAGGATSGRIPKPDRACHFRRANAYQERRHVPAAPRLLQPVDNRTCRAGARRRRRCSRRCSGCSGSPWPGCATPDAFGAPAAIGQLLSGAMVLIFLYTAGHYVAKLAARPGVVAEDLKILPGRAGLAALTMAGMLFALGAGALFASAGQRGAGAGDPRPRRRCWRWSSRACSPARPRRAR